MAIVWSKAVARRCGIPVELGAVEHLHGTLAERVACQDDSQESAAACFVVEGLLGLDLQGGVQAELIELKFLPRLAGVLGPLGHAGETSTFLAGRALALVER